MNPAEERELLIAALQYANAKFHGVVAGLCMVRAGQAEMNINGLIRVIEEGNALTGRLLDELPDRHYMPSEEVHRILGDRITNAEEEGLITFEELAST